MSVDVLHPAYGLPDEIVGLDAWQHHEYFDGTLHIDPHIGEDAAYFLGWAARRPVSYLEKLEDLEFLGSGTRGVVLGMGELAIKKFHAHKREEVSGFEAIRANLALAHSLDVRRPKIGSYALRGCRPRGYFEPRLLATHPTWLMDRVLGEDARDIVQMPDEAGPNMMLARRDACIVALHACGFDPRSIYIDEVDQNVMISSGPERVITMIDVMAAW